MKTAGAFLAIVIVAGCKPEPQEEVVTAKPDASAAVEEKPIPGPPLRVALGVEMHGAANRLSGLVKEGATDAKNPWMLAHGLLAFGKEMKTSDRRLAIDVIVNDYVEAHQVDGKIAYYSFPVAAKDGTPIEPHRNMMIKKMLEAGVPLEHTFKPKSSKEKVTLERLIADAERTFVPPGNDKDWRNFAWTIDAFLRARGDQGEIQSGDRKYPLRELAIRTIHRIEEEQSFLLPAYETNRPDKVEKKKQAIYGHTCGGMHLIQSGVHAAKYVQDPNATEAMKKQLGLLLFRWDAERRIYREYLANQPEFGVLLLIQELKFYGHLLETLAFAKEDGLLEADDAMKKEVAWIAGDLLNTIEQLEPAYAKAKELEKARPQSYYDLIGDGCHAIRGLRRSLMAFFPEAQIEKLQ